MFRDKATPGFTLIELLVVIAIIGILSSVVLASLNSARMKSRDARRISDLNQIRNALELYYSVNGTYPPSQCGYDCNGYEYSYNVTSWNTLQTALAPYIPVLPKDPINSNCTPWTDGCFSYAYGNVGGALNPGDYDLTAQLEDSNHPQRCGVKNWKFYFNNQAWCPAYSNQIYEASLQ